MGENAFRALPSADQFLNSEAGRGLIEIYGRALTLSALRSRLDAARDAIRAGDDGAVVAKRLPAEIAADLAAQSRPK
ncbi:L-seryl-tRNA(Sec) selenium transferase, partial [Salmonella enterica subsp. enterica serovar Enteritidis]|nr:L-seryl-tRNA(Sec) selenium transferase [Salmonella enterica subsp. enterica serovar Enteritidis]